MRVTVGMVVVVVVCVCVGGRGGRASSEEGGRVKGTIDVRVDTERGVTFALGIFERGRMGCGSHWL